jgi:hypothetical protein
MTYDSPPPPSKHWWIKVAEWLADYWLTISMIVVPFVLTLVGALLSDEIIRVLRLSDAFRDQVQSWAFCLLLLLAVVHLVLSIFQCCSQIRHTKLLAELDEAKQTRDLVISNAQALCDGYLQDLARSPLAFGTRAENSERITLYVHDSESHFQPVGRFSFNQSFIKRGRPKYPESQGCIGRAWQHGWHFQLLPNARDDEGAWIEECNKLGLSKKDAKALNMKSALYCACAIQNNGSPQPVAVIVVESTDSSRYTEDELIKILSDDRKNYIARLIEMLRPWLGDAGEARKKGF